MKKELSDSTDFYEHDLEILKNENEEYMKRVKVQEITLTDKDMKNG